MERTPEQISALLDRLESFFEDYDKADDGYRRGQWHDHFAEKLGPYEAKMKALNGDDFDIYGESYDEYNKDFKDLSEDEYVASLTANIDKLLDKLRGALGEEKVELESGPDGTEIVSHEDTGVKVNDASEETKEEPPAETAETAEVETKEETKADESEKEDETITSSENAKTRYDKRSASNKEKLKGWDPQKGLLRSDEDCKEETKEATPHPEDGEVTVDEIPGKVEKIDDTVKVEDDEDDELSDFIKEAEKAKKGARFLKQ